MGKLQQAEQQANARGPLARIYDGVTLAVSKDVAQIVGKDTLVALGSSFGKVPVGSSIAADKLYKLITGAKDFDHKYHNIAQGVSNKIN